MIKNRPKSQKVSKMVKNRPKKGVQKGSKNGQKRVKNTPQKGVLTPPPIPPLIFVQKRGSVIDRTSCLATTPCNPPHPPPPPLYVRN